MIPTIHRADESVLASGIWDVTQELREAAASAEGLLALWLTADSCPGCLMLKAQVVGDAADRLYAAASVVQLEAGDIQDRLVRRFTLGDTTLTVPGVPAMLLWRVEGATLRLASLSLGPLSPVDAHGDIKKLVEGTSRWIPEAAGAQIEFTRGAQVVQLGAPERFAGDILVQL